jgi:hypothetical protein
MNDGNADGIIEVGIDDDQSVIVKPEIHCIQ